MGGNASKCCSNSASESQEVVEKKHAAGGSSFTPKEEIIGDKGGHPGAVIASSQPEVTNQVPVTVQMPPPGKVDLAEEEFTIVLQKTAGSKLGVDVDQQDGVTLLVDAVTGGLMQAWNSANPDKLVKPGDRIVEINGCRGDVCQIVEECKKTQELVMKVKKGRS